jgi:hypothetical protein
MGKRELFSWATSVSAGLPVAALMFHGMFVTAAATSVLLAVAGVALMSWQERCRDCYGSTGKPKLDSLDAFKVCASRS